MSDDSAMEEGRLEEIEKELSTYSRYFRERAQLGRDTNDLLAEVRRLRAENDALKQQLQALREPEAS